MMNHDPINIDIETLKIVLWLSLLEPSREHLLRITNSYQVNKLNKSKVMEMQLWAPQSPRSLCIVKYDVIISRISHTSRHATLVCDVMLPSHHLDCYFDLMWCFACAIAGFTQLGLHGKLHRTQHHRGPCKRWIGASFVADNSPLGWLCSAISESTLEEDFRVESADTYFRPAVTCKDMSMAFTSRRGSPAVSARRPSLSRIISRRIRNTIVVLNWYWVCGRKEARRCLGACSIHVVSADCVDWWTSI